MASHGAGQTISPTDPGNWAGQDFPSGSSHSELPHDLVPVHSPSVRVPNRWQQHGVVLLCLLSVASSRKHVSPNDVEALGYILFEPSKGRKVVPRSCSVAFWFNFCMF
jgi:hypothetical protein